MILNDIFLHSQTNALTSFHQRDFLRQQKGIDAKIHNQILCTECLNLRSPQVPPSELQEKKWMKYCRSERRTWPTKSSQQGSQKLKLQAWGLHVSAPGPLHTCYNYQLRGFVGLPTVEPDVSLTCLPAIGTLFHYEAALSSLFFFKL